MNKRIPLFARGFLIVICTTLLSPSLLKAEETFWVNYVAPGYTASKFLTLPFPTAALEFDSDGNLYVSDANEFGTGVVNILKMDVTNDYTSWSRYVSYSTGMQCLNGLDFDDEGNLFASECRSEGSGFDAGLIRKIDATLFVGAPIIFSDFRSTGVATGKGDKTADVYFPGRKWSDPDFGNIYKIESFPGAEEIVRPDFVATGIAIDDFGNIFVSTRDSSIYRKVSNSPMMLRIATFNKIVEELNFDGDGNLYALELRRGTDYSTIIRLSPGGIDIKPGSFPNCFNQNEKGVLPVAIYGSSAIDVRAINVASLSLQGLGVKMVGRRGKYLAHADYINGDDYLDLVVQFEDSDSWEEPENGYAVLTGELIDGTPIQAGDSICLVPPKRWQWRGPDAAPACLKGIRAHRQGEKGDGFEWRKFKQSSD